MLMRKDELYIDNKLITDSLVILSFYVLFMFYSCNFFYMNMQETFRKCCFSTDVVKGKNYSV